MKISWLVLGLTAFAAAHPISPQDTPQDEASTNGVLNLIRDGKCHRIPSGGVQASIGGHSDCYYYSNDDCSSELVHDGPLKTYKCVPRIRRDGPQDVPSVLQDPTTVPPKGVADREPPWETFWACKNYNYEEPCASFDKRLIPGCVPMDRFWQDRVKSIKTKRNLNCLFFRGVHCDGNKWGIVGDADGDDSPVLDKEWQKFKSFKCFWGPPPADEAQGIESRSTESVDTPSNAPTEVAVNTAIDTAKFKKNANDGDIFIWSKTKYQGEPSVINALHTYRDFPEGPHGSLIQVKNMWCMYWYVKDCELPGGGQKSWILGSFPFQNDVSIPDLTNIPFLERGGARWASAYCGYADEAPVAEILQDEAHGLEPRTTESPDTPSETCQPEAQGHESRSTRYTPNPVTQVAVDTAIDTAKFKKNANPGDIFIWSKTNYQGEASAHMNAASTCRDFPAGPPPLRWNTRSLNQFKGAVCDYYTGTSCGGVNPGPFRIDTRNNDGAFLTDLGDKAFLWASVSCHFNAPEAVNGTTTVTARNEIPEDNVIPKDIGIDLGANPEQNFETKLSIYVPPEKYVPGLVIYYTEPKFKGLSAAQNGIKDGCRTFADKQTYNKRSLIQVKGAECRFYEGIWCLGKKLYSIRATHEHAFVDDIDGSKWGSFGCVKI